MKIKHCRQTISIESTESVDLNPEDFRDLSKPYTGNSEDEFKDYIFINYEHLDPYLLDELPEKVSNDLFALFDFPEWITEESNDGVHWLGNSL